MTWHWEMSERGFFRPETLLVKTAVLGECACTGNDALLIVYLTDADDSENAKNALVEALHLPANAIETRVIGSLPKNEAGKILYAKLNNK